MVIIYKITNKANGKIYIGQTVGSIEDRFYHHIYDALVLKKHTKLGRAIRKHSKECFSIEAIETTENLDEREIFWISHFKTVKGGYNIKIGGNGGPHASSTKKKISQANTRRIWTEEMRENMSIAIKAWHEERGFVPRSEEFKSKISKANRNRKMPKKAQDKFQAHNRKLMKPVICVNNEKEYESISAAAKALNLNSGQLSQHLKGKHEHVKGLVFKYK